MIQRAELIKTKLLISRERKVSKSNIHQVKMSFGIERIFKKKKKIISLNKIMFGSNDLWSFLFKKIR